MDRYENTEPSEKSREVPFLIAIKERVISSTSIRSIMHERALNSNDLQSGGEEKAQHALHFILLLTL